MFLAAAAARGGVPSALVPLRNRAIIGGAISLTPTPLLRSTASLPDWRVSHERELFVHRHIGPSDGEVSEMLGYLGLKTLDELEQRVVPDSIRLGRALKVREPFTESQLAARVRELATQNKPLKSLLGLGFHGTVTPPVLLRNLFENPLWYTPYTPYQPEISQGRLESLLNFQTMVGDLTGLPYTNASLLDEASAATEAMSLCGLRGWLVDQHCHPHTIDVLRGRALRRNVPFYVGDPMSHNFVNFPVSGVLVGYPNTNGTFRDYAALTDKAHAAKALVVAATDLLALTVLQPPGEWGADIAVGNSQRFGVPLGAGGPHAAFLAVREKDRQRKLPGRVVGATVDTEGRTGFRLILQTREQHIRREKATSNICTAQALLANLATMYAVYHGPDGLRHIAMRTHAMAQSFAQIVAAEAGHSVTNAPFFDTVVVQLKTRTPDAVIAAALERGINLRAVDSSSVLVAFDETVTVADMASLLSAFGCPKAAQALAQPSAGPASASLDPKLSAVSVFPRKSAYLTHPVFNMYHSETEMMRYLYRLTSKDYSLCHGMIPLGSCTMKLNAASEMMPLSLPEFANLHPFAPPSQLQGIHSLAKELADDLSEITGMDEVCLQPNAGSAGEYTGLVTIMAYHMANGQSQRNVCLIPASAHGTNPASAVLAGCKVQVVACTESGAIDMKDLTEKVAANANTLAAIMITYPSTYGVFDSDVRTVCDMVHKAGGQVYLDGANMNALLGTARPGDLGADCCHLNLHKTFAIPHGGGGPGIGPLCMKAHLVPFAPANPVQPQATGSAVTAAPLGSALALPISWAFVRMMGPHGLRKAGLVSMLTANYMAKRLEGAFHLRFRGPNDMVAHEFIIDLKEYKQYGIEAEDFAKRLMDYGMHAPTMSWPLLNSMMIEPTESESKAEADRFVAIMLDIHQDLQDIKSGKLPADDNPLVNAPHTYRMVTSAEWKHAYSRDRAAFPLPYLRTNKFWPTVGRLDSVTGDKNVVCACPPMDTYT